MPNLIGNEDKYLHSCITSTFVSSVGEYVNTFEEMVGVACGLSDSSCVVATSSGTTGLHVALTAVGVKYSDLIIIPTFTFIATANSIAHCGAKPWLMDVSSLDWCLNPKLVREEIEEHCVRENEKLIYKPTGQRVAALMPVYTLGNIPDMKAFRAIANEYGLPLVVDAACAIGATYKGSPFAPLADLSVLSFNGNKTITCGGGGAVVVNSYAELNDTQRKGKELADYVRHLTTTARVWPDYDFDEVGFNYRMTNVQAAIGCAQMERLDSFIVTKRRVRAFYKDKLQTIADSHGITFFPATDGSSCWFSGIVMPKGYTLAESKMLCEKLKEKGIEAKPFWKPVHLQKPYIDCPKSDVRLSEGLWQRIITLPCSTGITDEELDVVTSAVEEVLR